MGAVPDGQYLLRSSSTLRGTSGGASGVGIAAGTASSSAGGIVLSNANNISFGLNGSTVTMSIAWGGIGAVSVGTVTAGAGSIVLSNSNNISFGIAANAVTASVGTAGKTISYYANLFGFMWPSMCPPLYNNSSMSFFCLEPNGFPGQMTVSTLNLRVYGFNGGGMLDAFTVTCMLGLYTLANSTQLTLINSASLSWGTNASAPLSVMTNLFYQNRLIGFSTSNWSSLPVLNYGGHYWFGLLALLAGGATSTLAGNWRLFGVTSVTTIHSGVMGVSNTNSTLYRAQAFLGGYRSTTNACPTAVAATDILQSDNYVPHVQLANGVDF
jgi:hypothetical protein